MSEKSETKKEEKAERGFFAGKAKEQPEVGRQPEVAEEPAHDTVSGGKVTTAAPPAPEFKEPDNTKPILDIQKGLPVTVVILRGKTVAGEDAALVHVQDSLLTPYETKSRFTQGPDGTVYYSAHGATVDVNQKPVDIVELAS
jgi:hypothetical protein